MNNVEINYEKAFKKLVEQIRVEQGWAEEDMRDETEWNEQPNKYTRGMLFAYRSMSELARKLETGTFDFNA